MTQGDRGITQFVQEVFCEELGVGDCDAGASLFELGGDSMTVIAIMAAVEERFGVELRADVFLEDASVTSITTQVQLALQGGTIDDEAESSAQPLGRPGKHRPLLVVLYGPGAAGPVEIAAAAPEDCDVAFIAAQGMVGPRELRALHAGFTALTMDLQGDMDAVERAIGDLAPDGIVTFSDYLVGQTSRLARARGLPGLSERAAAAATDKAAQRELLASVPALAVRWATADDIDQAAAVARTLGLPCMLKPRRGAGSRLARVIHTSQDLITALEGTWPEGGVILEELLVGVPQPFGADYVSVESVAHAGRITHVGVTGKLPLVEPFRETGEFLPCALDADQQQQVLICAEAAIRALGIECGLTHTEVKLTCSGPRIIEVNARLGGAVAQLYRRAGGPDLVRAAGDIALGRAPQLVAEPQPGGVVYSFNNLAPAGARSLTGVRGAELAGERAKPGRYEPFLKEGDQLVGGGATDPIDLISGQALDYQQVGPALRAVIEPLRFEFRMGDGSIAGFDAGQLPSEAAVRRMGG